MATRANVDSLIVDLRQNGGGSTDAVALLATYLVGPAPTHLNDIYDPRSRRTRQSWTLSYVAGRPLFGAEVYVLTSRDTFSAGEEFAYDLQAIHRATTVGERTRGAANSGSPRRLSDHFVLKVPTGVSINPVTKTNWDGVGVRPDIETPAAEAFAQAYLMALKKSGRTPESAVPPDPAGPASPPVQLLCP